MTEKFEQDEPIFGIHRTGIKAIVLISGKDAVYHGLPLTQEQHYRLVAIVQDIEHPWMQEYYRKLYDIADGDSLPLAPDGDIPAMHKRMSGGIFDKLLFAVITCLIFGLIVVVANFFS